ncbi:hypothetical protein ACI3KW_02075 [Devosia sp. ZW T5_3]|uniref:hypothetical protein n=1 Tax=Devosia sp. ZW T5_3 TaxID=3378085 RepID=UPI003852C2FC
MTKKPTPRKSRAKSVTGDRVEWTLASAAALTVLSLFGYLVYDAFAAGDGRPRIELQRGEISGSGPVYLEVEVSNFGSGTAADVEIEGEVRTASGKPVLAHASLDYAPAESTKSITLVFPAGTSGDAVELRVAGFRDP